MSPGVGAVPGVICRFLPAIHTRTRLQRRTVASGDATTTWADCVYLSLSLSGGGPGGTYLLAYLHHNSAA